MYHITALVLLAALASASPAPAPSSAQQQQPYAQCGGQSFTGGTTCTSGWTCIYSNPWYSQCLPASSSSAAAAAPKPTSSAAAPPPPASTPTAVLSTNVAPTTSAVSTSPAAASSAPVSSGGATYKASFTHYGAGDSFGSPNCQTDTAACGFFTSPGFAAAVSQNLYGAGPGAGAGPACGTCYKLVGETDSSGNALTNAGTSIIVMINNLCPASGNPLCSQNTLTDTNQYGANVNFDLCSDSGASAAFFGSDGEGLAVGTATEVSCSDYSGTIVH